MSPTALAHLQVGEWNMDRPAQMFLADLGSSLAVELPLRVYTAITQGRANPQRGVLTTSHLLRMSVEDFTQIKGIGPTLAHDAVNAIRNWVTAGLGEGTITCLATAEDDTSTPSDAPWEEIAAALVESHRSYSYTVIGPWGVDSAEDPASAVAEVVKARAEHRAIYGRDERYWATQARRTMTIYFADDSFYEAAPESLAIPEPTLSPEEEALDAAIIAAGKERQSDLLAYLREQIAERQKVIRLHG